jgi:nicotinamide mononucleotide transporter
MINPWEIAANLFNAASILLAGRNSVHTWWTGIVGSVLFTWVFFASKLYADTTLQLFFIATSIAGWWNWRRGLDEADKPVLRTGARALLPMIIAALTFSVLGQFLLMGRRLETWWCWLLVNAIATPLYFSRGLHLTAALYAVFWVNALVSLRHWRRLQAHA